MKVLFVKPCWNYPIDKGDSTYNRNWPPLSLLNCAALVRREGIDVEVVDAAAERLSPEAVALRAAECDKVFITSASLDRWQCPNIVIDPFLKTVFALKKVCREVYVMGTHGTVRPREILDATGVTAVIVGEPEEAVLSICRGITLGLLQGVAYEQDGRFCLIPQQHDLDLTALPIPAYDLIDLKQYRYEVLGERFALIEASRGCPFNCIFCVKSMYGSAYRCKTIEQVIREIDYVIDVARAQTIYFIDLEFTVNRDMVKAVCDHFIRKKSGVEWCCQTRTDSVDETMLAMMKEAGCRIVHFGVETGSERIRANLKKGITREQIENGLRMTRVAGLQTVCFFMFGLPGETIADMEETIRFAKKLNPTYASFHIALPYPGTEFHEMARENIGTELFPKAYTGEVCYDDLIRVARRAFRSYYLRPRYIAGRMKDRDFRTFYRQARFFISYLIHRLWS